MLQEIQEVFDIVKQNNSLDALEVGYDLAVSAFGKEETHDDGIVVAKYVRDKIERIIVPDIEDEVARVREAWRIMDTLRDNVQVTEETDLYLRVLLLLARNRDFDSYLLYLEKNRIHRDRFYLPNQEQGRQLAKSFSILPLLDGIQENLTCFFHIHLTLRECTMTAFWIFAQMRKSIHGKKSLPENLSQAQTRKWGNSM